MPIVKNVFLGIQGWSNATYAAKARRSNAGNAYEVVTPGTSTSPPTGTGSSINNGGTAVWKYLAAVDYTTLQAAADDTACIPATRTQMSELVVWNCGTYTATFGQMLLWLQGHGGGSSTNLIYIHVATGDSFIDTFIASSSTALFYNTANGLAIEWPNTASGSVNMFTIDDDWVVIEGFQFRDPNSGSLCSFVGGSGNRITIRRNVFDGYAQNSGASLVGVTGTDLLITNNLFYGRNTTVGANGIVGPCGNNADVVNNAFVHATNVSGQRVLDAQSGASGLIGRNNIYFNYDIPYSAPSGNLWTNDHCGFSASSFQIANNATDSGSNVFSLTSSALFLNFPSDLGPKSSAGVINAGVTDTTNVPDAKDIFKTSRPQGAAWDIGCVERILGTTVFADMVSPAAWNMSKSSDVSSAGEVLVTRAEDRPALTEVRASLTADMPSVAAFLTTMRVDAPHPVEWRLTVLTPTRDFPVPIEWRAAITRDHFAATDWRISLILDQPGAAEASAGRIVDRPSPIEAGLSAARTFDFPLEENAVGRFDSANPLEFLGTATFSTDTPAAVEWRSTVRRDQSIPIEATAAVAYRDIQAPFEVQAITPFDLVAGGEWRASLVATVAVAAEGLTTAIRDVAAAPETGLTRLADASGGFEAAATLAADSQAPLERGLTATRDLIVPLDPLANPVRDNPSGMEWRLGLTLDFSTPADSQTQIQVSELFAGAFDRLQERFFHGPIEPGSLVVLGRSSPVEWDHLLLVRIVDHPAVAEFGCRLVVDFPFTLAVNLGQETIGAVLEPDAWEEANA